MVFSMIFSMVFSMVFHIVRQWDAVFPTVWQWDGTKTLPVSLSTVFSCPEGNHWCLVPNAVMVTPCCVLQRAAEETLPVSLVQSYETGGHAGRSPPASPGVAHPPWQCQVRTKNGTRPRTKSLKAWFNSRVGDFWLYHPCDLLTWHTGSAGYQYVKSGSFCLDSKLAWA